MFCDVLNGNAWPHCTRGAPCHESNSVLLLCCAVRVLLGPVELEALWRVHRENHAAIRTSNVQDGMGKAGNWFHSLAPTPECVLAQNDGMSCSRVPLSVLLQKVCPATRPAFCHSMLPCIDLLLPHERRGVNAFSARTCSCIVHTQPLALLGKLAVRQVRSRMLRSTSTGTLAAHSMRQAASRTARHGKQPATWHTSFLHRAMQAPCAMCSTQAIHQHLI